MALNMLMFTHFLGLYNVFYMSNNFDVSKVHYASLFRVKVGRYLSANEYIDLVSNISGEMGDLFSRLERTGTALSYHIHRED